MATSKTKTQQSPRLKHKPLKSLHAKRKNVKQPHNPSASRHLIAREREQEALELRKQGLSYPEIGKRLGVSQVSAYQSVMRVLEGIERDIEEKVPQVRQLELARLDRDLKVLEPKIKKGDIKAIEASLKVAHMRCRILGVYAPEEVKHSGEITVFHEMSDAAIDLEMQALLAAVPELKQLAAGVLQIPVGQQVIDVKAETVPSRVNGKANGKA